MLNEKTHPPRRGPGWEALAFPLAVAVSMSVIALLEWWRWALRRLGLDVGYHPAFFTLVAAACAIWAGVRFWCVAKARRDAPGDTMAAQRLAELETLGYRVFHDVGEDERRVEHALVGPGGVFAIETRGARTPPGLTAVRYDGHAVRLNGRSPDRAPVAAAEGQATRLREILHRQGADPPVQAVLLYDRWNVVGAGDADSAWVLNCKGLAERLAGRPRALADGDVRRIADLLSPRARSGPVE